MGKNRTINELTNILAIALRHKIGSIVNPDEIYSQKYAKDAEVFMAEARKVSLRENWNQGDKLQVIKELEKKLRSELEKRDFLKEEKFEIMSREIKRALSDLGIS